MSAAALLLALAAADFDLLAAAGPWAPGAALGAAVPPGRRDLSGFGFVALRTRVRAAAVAEVEFHTAAGVRHWRRLDLAPGGWQRHELPLRWFRPGDAQRLDWTNLVRAGVRRRAPGVLEVAEFRLAGAAAEFRVEVERLAFGGRPASRTALGFAHLHSDAPPERVHAQALMLRSAARALRALPGLDSEPPELPVLLLFADAKDYRAFIPDLAARYGATEPRALADGHSLGGVAATACSAAHPDGRPVLAHEFAHAWLAQHGVPNDGSWLQEGLAVRVRHAAAPEPGFAAAARTALPDAWPLERVVAAKPLPLDRYWQATTFVGMLLDDPRYAPRMAPLLAAARRGAALDVPKLLGAEWPALEAAWRRRVAGPR